MSGDCITGSGSPVRCLVDHAVLEQLRRELDDDEGWLQFLSNYLAHLPRRIEKLRAGLETADYDLSMDAVLSLKISSQMVGAERLAELAVQLQGHIGVLTRPDWPRSDLLRLLEMFGDIAVLAGPTGRVLRESVAPDL